MPWHINAFLQMKPHALPFNIVGMLHYPLTWVAAGNLNIISFGKHGSFNSKMLKPWRENNKQDYVMTSTYD